ncbi:MAG: hypothetical protein A3B74_00010 [Candidatus Kerfeldbacteria bacterium RIFCSPHIGHO2_02_FULL_42_14]|uniref:Glycosyltransferase RgtA/B/C/D-like domain-containing protein n=1 Tax=Candidatus Kerfeldbacteria bacterium RIFCSPHIGHO2_02_FULL_42_14 TaxID=1798540 RepID=A0A1G2ARV6_9BACT|nr:MAG: hypothetical protein A3B74_00010 [Candidatus Kerfeldbacteria bacterium RIFCSPHIGHO2_02_FULL_42_14]OGY81339.1 MAG: hypothetical protein A3E60_02730 [Candidatus Kerfeldbacteria bacterium RIFCSPHIGHO2_12_FULL_42_13]OGY83613.1 MAG: hypothetical protein A3I91_03160 [Candidatus Kerfeldbacteria bacterium RIFCSPLOWO2_02_FULL_42_19]OGY86673.1 MAG: hypothetical protein A3G01_00460 [Candidatus Kerfeldbacteria bacterium RIFCSPLOWO2_12_FULL_43_9]
MKLETLFFRLLLTFFASFSLLLTLAIYGKFNLQLVFIVLVFFLGLFVISVVVSAIRYRGFRDIFSREQRWEWLVVLLVLGLTVLTGFFSHDLARGRDESGYMAAAIKIAETGSLAFKDESTYPFHPFRLLSGTDDALFTSQFFPGYNVYLATWYLFGGLSALRIANTLILFLSLVSLYYVGKYAYNFWVGVGTILLFSSSYVFFWFPRRTLSENIFLFLLWAGLAFLLRSVRIKNFLSAVCGFVPISLLLLVRVETLPLIVTYCVAVLFILFRYKVVVISKKYMILIGLWSLWHLSLLGYYLKTYGQSYFFESYQHLVSLAKPVVLLIILFLFAFILWSFFRRHRESFGGLSSMIPAFFRYRFVLRCILIFIFVFSFTAYAIWIQAHEFLPWRDIKMYFVFRALHLYFLTPFLLGGLGAFLYGYLKKELWLVIFVVAPFFIFLFDPFIALDQPWFMRRYYPTLVPLLYLLTSLFVVRYFEPLRLGPKIIFVLVVLQVSLFYPIVTFAEHRGVQRPLAAFAARFGSRDLFLMQPGWDWQQWAYPLHYVYKQDVLPNLDSIDTDTLNRILAQHEQVYVISKTASPLFGEIYPGIDNRDLEFAEEFSFRFPAISRTSRITHYVEENDFLDVAFVMRSLRGTPPIKFFEQEERWYIYRLRDGVRLEASALKFPPLLTPLKQF